MTWTPSSYHPIITPPTPGDSLAFLIAATEGYTSKKRLPKVDLTFKFENGYRATFGLVFGIADRIDQQNSRMVDTLFEAAGLRVDAGHQLIDLVRRLKGKLLGLHLDLDPSELSLTGLRLKEIFLLAEDEPDNRGSSEMDDEGREEEPPAGKTAEVQASGKEDEDQVHERIEEPEVSELTEGVDLADESEWGDGKIGPSGRDEPAVLDRETHLSEEPFYDFEEASQAFKDL